MFQSPYFKTKKDKEQIKQIALAIKKILKENNAALYFYDNEGFEITVEKEDNNSVTLISGIISKTDFCKNQSNLVLMNFSKKEYKK
jgi:hypothetical protein